MPGIQVLRMEKRVSIGGALGGHIDGLMRPDEAVTRAGMEAVELLDLDGRVMTLQEQEDRKREAQKHLDECRKVRSRGPKPRGAVEFIVAGLDWNAAIEKQREYIAAAGRHLLKCGGPGCRLAHLSLHLDETTPHGHAVLVVADEKGRLGWNRVRSGFGMTGAESGRALMGAMQERFHREVAHGFGLGRGTPGSGLTHEPIDRVAGVKKRLEEEREVGRVAGRTEATAEHEKQLEEVRRQHAAAAEKSESTIKAWKQKAEFEKTRFERFKEMAVQCFTILSRTIAGRKVMDEQFAKIDGFRIEWHDRAGGEVVPHQKAAHWVFWPPANMADMQPPQPPPLTRPAPPTVPQPGHDRGHGGQTR